MAVPRPSIHIFVGMFDMRKQAKVTPSMIMVPDRMETLDKKMKKVHTRIFQPDAFCNINPRLV